MIATFRASALAIAVLTMTTGCERQPDITFTTPPQWKELPEPVQAAAAKAIEAGCGTFAAPRLLGSPNARLSHLLHGQHVYQLRCAQCHGNEGDGNGPVASQMYPRPRDYRQGVFKFTSTGYGAKPLRSDLLRTLDRGVRGTSMPSFSLLPDEDIEAVVDYVLALTHRGELGDMLFLVGDAEGELNDEIVQSSAVEPILEKWKSARESVILPLTPEPELTAERAQRGRELFLKDSIGCLKCHGDDGRGRTKDNLAGALKDKWGNPTRAADLTSGFLRGGQEPIDIYRRILGGINGTPMPAFATAFRDNPDAVWDLVAYVKYITNRRRAGEAPAPGLIKPFVPQSTSDTPADNAG